MRPPGYEPGELPTAPLRDINHKTYPDLQGKCPISELRLQRYDFLFKLPNISSTI